MMFPASVRSVTHCWAIFSTDAPSNGSDLIVIVSPAGLAFFFGGSLAGSAGLGTCPCKERANVNTQATEHTASRNQFLALVSFITRQCPERRQFAPQINFAADS